MFSSVVKGSGDIFSRLFDHRPFTSGEINYFIREFEESRKNREWSRVEEIKEYINRVKECQVEDSLTVTTNLSKLSTLVDVATDNCYTVLENERLFDSTIALKENREKRAKAWESFNREIETSMTHIDSTFVEKEKQLIEMYKDLDRKLHLTH